MSLVDVEVIVQQPGESVDRCGESVPLPDDPCTGAAGVVLRRECVQSAFESEARSLRRRHEAGQVFGKLEDLPLRDRNLDVPLRSHVERSAAELGTTSSPRTPQLLPAPPTPLRSGHVLPSNIRYRKYSWAKRALGSMRTVLGARVTGAKVAARLQALQGLTKQADDPGSSTRRLATSAAGLRDEPGESITTTESGDT